MMPSSATRLLKGEPYAHTIATSAVLHSKATSHSSGLSTFVRDTLIPGSSWRSSMRWGLRRGTWSHRLSSWPFGAKRVFVYAFAQPSAERGSRLWRGRKM